MVWFWLSLTFNEFACLQQEKGTGLLLSISKNSRSLAECAPETLVNSRFDLSAITTPTLARYRTYLLRHRFGYQMAESVPLHRLAHIMGHDSLDTAKLYIQGTRHDVQQAVETIAWT